MARYFKSPYSNKSYRDLRYKKGGIVKSGKGQIKAAKNATDNASFTIAVNHPFSLQSVAPVNSFVDLPEGTKVGNVYAINVYDVLAKSPNFQRFRNMFDQVRIDRIECKLQVTNQIVNTAASTNLYDIYVAIDRNGIDNKYVIGSYSEAKDANNLANLDRYYLNIGSAIASIGSNTKTQLNAYQKWSLKRYIWPSSLQEKSQFVATDDIFSFDNFYNNATSGYMLNSAFIQAQVDTTSEADYEQAMLSVENKDTPTLLTSNAKFPFKPTILVGAFVANTVQDTGAMNAFGDITEGSKILMNAEFKIACTFRGSKGNDTV
jgi:hypothetical protein